MTVLVTGATGTTGRRVADRLRARGADVRAVSRPRFDWSAPDTWPAALAGLDAVYLVAPTRDADPATVTPPFLELAREVGVRRVVALSGAAIPEGGPQGGTAHALLPGLFEEWAVLRPSWFMQNVTGDHHVARELRARGTITTAAADGRLAFVDADDIAEVAVRALTDDRSLDEALVVTGPESLSWDAVAELLEATHVRVDVEGMRSHLAGFGVPEPTASLLAHADALLVAGAVEAPTDVVERVTGRPPRSFAAFVGSLRSP